MPGLRQSEDAQEERGGRGYDGKTTPLPQPTHSTGKKGVFKDEEAFLGSSGQITVRSTYSLVFEELLTSESKKTEGKGDFFEALPTTCVSARSFSKREDEGT